MTQRVVVPNEVTYSVLLGTCEKSKPSNHARKVSMDLFRALRWQSLLPNAILYNCLITALEQAKQPEMAMQALKAMW